MFPIILLLKGEYPIQSKLSLSDLQLDLDKKVAYDRGLYKLYNFNLHKKRVVGRLKYTINMIAYDRKSLNSGGC